jgi:hypothetical protein
MSLLSLAYVAATNTALFCFARLLLADNTAQ